MIQGVLLKRLQPVPDERGMVMEILRSDDEFFARFGQVYLSTVYPGVVKGWHYHKVQTDHIAVIRGMVKFVLFDDRPGSATRGELVELFIGEQNPQLVVVPPGVLHGAKAVGTEPAWMINCPTEPYNRAQPDEFRRPPDDPAIPYNWRRKDG
jgi:dTDP-4-dehydrorhamnose 3,5-epimerase